MKKSIYKILGASLILIFIIANSVFAEELKLKDVQYSSAYEEYMQLSDEEKQEVLEPRKYELKSTYNNTNDALLANKRITLKNMANLLRSELSITSSKFTLRTLIASNLAIRSQGDTNICWAIASLSSLETNLALQDYYKNNNQEGTTVYDYSEKHMSYAKTQMYSDKTNSYGYDYTASDGGSMLMAISYLSNGQGAVSEDKMPFDNDDTTKVESSTVESLEAETTVDSMIMFDTLIISSTTTTEEIENEKNAIKQHIIDYGSVYAAIDSSSKYTNLQTGAIYNNSSTLANHAISIVGWDDDYSVDNFNSAYKPSSNGAWIVRNSWGETLEYTFDEYTAELISNYGYTEDYITANWDTLMAQLTEQGYTVDNENKVIKTNLGVSEADGGEGYGYFYVSYEDILVYSNCYGIVSAESEKTYDNIYQYDELGIIAVNTLDGSTTYDTYMANVFTRTTTDTEYLTSVGITNAVSATYEVYINPNGIGKTADDLQLATLADGTNQITLTAGYNTIDLQNAFELTGTNFVVVLKELHSSETESYIPFEYGSSSYGTSCATSNSGESFVTLDVDYGFGANVWIDSGDITDTANYCGNLCIKGFTTTSYSGTIANAKETPSEGGNNGNTTNTTGGENTTSGENTTGNTTENTTSGENTTENTTGNTTENTTENNTSVENTTGNTTTNTVDDNNTTGNTQNNSGDTTVVAVNNGYSSARAKSTYIQYYSDYTTIKTMKIQIDSIVLADEDETFEQYYYISPTSGTDTTSISSSEWTKVDSFEKQSDGTYSITLTVTEDIYNKYIGSANENIYVYIKEVATKQTATSTLITDGMLVTADTDSLNIDVDGNTGTATVIDTSNSLKNSDDTTSTSGLPYTGIKTIFVILLIVTVFGIYIYIKYNGLKDVK